ncbi:MAG: 4Fe-4S binding protein [Sulfolobales archaeon]
MYGAKTLVLIDHGRCIGCGICIPYCPRSAIRLDPNIRKAYINTEECVECGTCVRVVQCPRDAIVGVVEGYVREVQAHFSDPYTLHPSTGIPGRGTEEMKTNDVTGRFKKGEVGFAIDIGRPLIGVTFAEVGRFIRTLNTVGVEWEKANPILYLLKDLEKGEFPEELKKVKIHSAVLEFKVPISRVRDVIEKLKYLAETTDTVFSLGVISRVEEDFTIPVINVLGELGLKVSPWAKTNVGLGRPLIE